MPKQMETDSKGIPIKGPYPANPPVFVLYTIMTTVFTSIIGTISYFVIVKKDNDLVAAKLELLAQYELGYLYVAIIFMKLGQLAMGINAGTARKYCKGREQKSSLKSFCHCLIHH